jgi:hypothetical protein
MNRLISGFKECAHQAGEICNLTNGVLVRRFGLGDFLENKLTETDGAADIAIKALQFFCDERDPHNDKFRFGVLTVGLFLDEHYGSATPYESLKDLQQPLKDLVALLAQSPKERQLRKWIQSNFGDG